MPDDLSQDDMLQSLGQDARVRNGVSRMIPIRGPLGPQLSSEIVAALRTHMRDAELSQADVAKALGHSVTYVNNLLNLTGTLPPETRDQMLRDINVWLDREARAKENVRPDHFVETGVVEAVFHLAHLLGERPAIGVGWGPSSIGKTLAAEAIAAELNAIYVRIDKDSRSATGLVTKIYNAASRRKRSGHARIFEVVEKLRMPPKVNTPMLVILDEAHALVGSGPYDAIRDIFDQAKCSFLLLGTVDLKTHVDLDNQQDFGQFAGRAHLRVDLVAEAKKRGGGSRELLFTAADIRAFCNRGKLRVHPDALRLLVLAANHSNAHLRTVEALHHYAEKSAVKRGAPMVMAVHVQAAMKIVCEELTRVVRVQEREVAQAISA